MKPKKIATITILLITVAFLLVVGVSSANEKISLNLTEEEKIFIKEHPVITLAPDPNFAPVEFFNAEGDFEGIVSDYVMYINYNTDLNIKIMKYDHWSQIIEAIKNKEIDMLGGVSKSKQREEYLLFSESYLDIPNVFVSRKTDLDVSKENISNFSIGVIKDSANQDLLKEHFPTANIVPIDNTAVGLERASIGDLDIFAGSLGQISYYIDQYKYTNLKIVKELDYSYPIHFAVRKDYKALQSILNKILISMPKESKHAISEKWIHLNTTSYFISKDFFLKLMFGLGIILVGSFLIIRFLRYEVNKQTKEVKLLNQQLKEALLESKEMTEQIALSMLNLIQIHDNYTRNHSENVTYYTKAIVKALDFNEKQQEQAYYSAILHDLGKVLISSEIIGKKGKLTDKEYEEIKKHSFYSHKILKTMKCFKSIANNVLSHHERYDGLGYPDGLAGEDIPIIARIICVADAFDAMTTSRSYKQKISVEKAVQELKENANTQFDPTIVELFVQLIREKIIVVRG